MELSSMLSIDQVLKRIGLVLCRLPIGVALRNPPQPLGDPPDMGIDREPITLKRRHRSDHTSTLEPNTRKLNELGFKGSIIQPSQRLKTAGFQSNRNGECPNLLRPCTPEAARVDRSPHRRRTSATQSSCGRPAIAETVAGGGGLFERRLCGK
jgi:hypothetical protein